MSMKRVSKAEFDRFLEEYPGELERDICGIGDPPVVSYNDFTLGDWPESVVARHGFYDLLGKIPSDWEIDEERRTE